MFLESTNGLHVEDLCVYNSAARPDHILDLRTHSSDAADLICHIKYGSAVLQYDDTPLFTVTRTVYLPHGSHYRLSFLKESA